MGTTYLAIALEHPLAKIAAEADTTLAKSIKKLKKSKVSEAEIATQEKAGVKTSFTAIRSDKKTYRSG